MSHAELSAPPVLEHVELALGATVVAVCFAGGAVVAGAALVVVAPAGAPVVDVVVEATVVVVLFFLAAVGDEPHAAATSETAPSASISVESRGAAAGATGGRRRGPVGLDVNQYLGARALLSRRGEPAPRPMQVNASVS